MAGRARDPLDSMLQGFPDLRAPEGFQERLQARLGEGERPCVERYNPFQVSGIVCIASAAVMFIVMRTPLIDLIPHIIQALGGFLQ